VVEDSLKRRSIAVAVELPEELPTIHGSQGDLTQVFLNVFSNARDAMPDGGRLEIRAENDAERVRVTVADDGSGIPREALERISEPFFTTKPDGNGLGLSICRSIVWDVGGEMSIDSREGEGTTVKLSLPVLAEVRQEAAG
jgi:signal transduction histidine kinase